MYDVITIGSIIKDVIFFTNEGLIIKNPKDPRRQKLIAFEAGAKIYIYLKDTHISLGGSAANTAIGLAKLGIKPAMISWVAKDCDGDWIIKELKKAGINIKFIQRGEEMISPFSMILSLKESRDHTIFAYRGSNSNLKSISQNQLKTKYILLSSLTCPNWRQVLNKIFIGKTKYKIIWNPGLAQLKTGYRGLAKYLKKTDVLIVNQDEAIELILSSRKYKKSKLNIQNLLKELYQMGPNLVIITAGEKGAYAYDGRKEYCQRPNKVKIINTTGAGDAFCSGLVASFIYQPDDIKQALKWGTTNSSAVITKIGAQRGLLNLRKIKRLS